MFRERLQGAQGYTTPQFIANENAWSAIIVPPLAVFNNATVKLIVGLTAEPLLKNTTFDKNINYTIQGPDFENEWLDYPGADGQELCTDAATGVYLDAGITEAGVYSLLDRIGGVYAALKWSGGDASTDITVGVMSQMV